MKRLILSFAALALCACSGGGAADGAITVEPGFIAEPVSGRDVTAGFLTVRSDTPRRLVGVSSPAADRIEIHTMRMVDGVMSMRKVDGMDVGPDAPIVLESGGDHLMIFGLRDVPDSDQVTLTLQFEDGAAQDVQLPVRAR